MTMKASPLKRNMMMMPNVASRVKSLTIVTPYSSTVGVYA